MDDYMLTWRADEMLSPEQGSGPGRGVPKEAMCIKHVICDVIFLLFFFYYYYIYMLFSHEFSLDIRNTKQKD